MLPRPAEERAHRNAESSPTRFDVADSKRVGSDSSRAEVLARLGPPSARAGQAVWIYRNYEVSVAGSTAARADTLLVIFRDDVVSQLRLVDGAAVDRLLSRMDSPDG